MHVSTERLVQKNKGNLEIEQDSLTLSKFNKLVLTKVLSSASYMVDVVVTVGVFVVVLRPFL